MFSQEQLVEKGIEIGHWPTFERHPSKRKHQFVEVGHMVGMIYDTTGWPFPNEVYHPDNYKCWHCDDPNRPALSKAERDEDRRVAAELEDIRRKYNKAA